MPNIGPFEMVIIFLVVLIIFGPKSLPKIGQALGRGIREFKDAAKGLTADDDEPRRQVTQPAPRDAITQSPTAVSAEQTNPPVA